MLYGNCVSYKDIQHIKILKETGFDYAETALSQLYTATKGQIDDFAGALSQNQLKCAAVNVMFPGDIRLTGENAEFARVGEYLDEVLEKTKALKFGRVVFGSGGARKVPEGFGKEAAMEQLVGLICDHLVPAARKYDFVIVVEELNKGETNILNYIGECADLVKRVNIPRVRLLADLYHIALENDDLDKLPGYGDILAHCHIANPYDSRFYPRATDAPEAVALYKKFFEKLRAAGYAGGVTIEGKLDATTDTKDIQIPAWVGEEDKLFYANSKKSLEFMKAINN